MHWNFQNVKCIIMHGQTLEQGDRREGGVQEAESNKGFQKNEHGCRLGGVFVLSNPTSSPYLKPAGLTWTNQSSSKVRLFQNWKAGIQDMQLWLISQSSRYHSQSPMISYAKPLYLRSKHYSDIIAQSGISGSRFTLISSYFVIQVSSWTVWVLVTLTMSWPAVQLGKAATYCKYWQPAPRVQDSKSVLAVSPSQCGHCEESKPRPEMPDTCRQSRRVAQGDCPCRQSWFGRLAMPVSSYAIQNPFTRQVSSWM